MMNSGRENRKSPSGLTSQFVIPAGGPTAILEYDMRRRRLVEALLLGNLIRATVITIEMFSLGIIFLEVCSEYCSFDRSLSTLIVLSYVVK